MNEIFDVPNERWVEDLDLLDDMDESLIGDRAESEKRKKIIDRRVSERHVYISELRAHAWAQKGTIFERRQELIRAYYIYVESIILQLKSLKEVGLKRVKEISPFVDLLYLHAQGISRCLEDSDEELGFLSDVADAFLRVYAEYGFSVRNYQEKYPDRFTVAVQAAREILEKCYWSCERECGTKTGKSFEVCIHCCPPSFCIVEQ